ncbi:MAG: hypothetical protein AAGE59_23050 [Cyanobacteria bacterium P01_F01_bin.86]
MSLPRPVSKPAAPRRSRSRRRQIKRRRPLSREAQLRALGWEMTGRLTLNLILTLVALSTLVRLIPYYQTQRQVLHEVEGSVVTEKAQTDRLRADFGRYFDPTQTNQITQETGIPKSDQHIPIVLVDPLSPQSGSSADE